MAFRGIKLSKYQRNILATALIVAIAALFGVDLNSINSSIRSDLISPTPDPRLNEERTDIKVVKVLDGDTIVVEGNVKVRYIGINTPEIYKDSTGQKTGEECFADKSFEENKRLVEGRSVRLEKDVSNTDKYGRLLRYVYVGDLFVNDHLISNGYAKIMTIKPDIKFSSLFKKSQNRAKTAGFGIWTECVISTPKSPR